MRRTALKRLVAVAATLAVGGVAALPMPASADSDNCVKKFDPNKDPHNKKPYCVPPPTETF
jgi:hypothetical protein